MFKQAIKYITFLCIAAFCLTLTNCSKDDIGIDIKNDIIIDNENSDNKDNSGNSDNSGSSDNSGTDSGSDHEVTLSANILSMLTKASSTSPIGTNRYVDAYVYTSGHYYDTYHYISSSSGTLSPTHGSTEMILPTGTYTLYTPGVNTAGIAVPTFQNNATSDLANATDYIWTTKTIVVTDQSQTVDLVLNRCAIQVVIQIELDSVTLDTSTTPTMTITPPDSSDCSWNLTSGKITAATSLSSTTASMGVTVSTSTDTVIVGQLIMLPLSSSDSITYTFI